MCSIHLQWEAGAFGTERTLYEILVVEPPPVCSLLSSLSSSPPSSSSESPCLEPSPAELSDFFKALQLAYNVRSESIAFACQGNRGGRWDNIGGDELDAGSYADEECDICPQVAAGEQTVTRCAEAILITWSFQLLMNDPKRRVYDLEFLPGIKAVNGDAFGLEDWEVGAAWAKKLKVFCGMD
ncbi:hypothetical protein N0V93_010294 [Gnomoniopsis smithogilvyi]|uniref:Uncharacterized protein n=1 Tax=Gnomoniopsis smithogilvyi TaxID=1191159 RepID=A0A9W9CSQ8_9PEZI|nr:hypothetical protein N0V93_010294 [Gnomoniopsis smithogilvyi]